MIDQYQNFKVGNATCSIPYFNNKTIGGRGVLRVYGGKGSPKEIYEEVLACMTKDHVDTSVLSNESLRKYISDKNIGMDCSGLAYYILETESRERKIGQFDKKIRFINCHGLFGKIRCALRPVENCDVKTFADNRNSKFISIKEVAPGDIITMVGGATEASGSDRDHILVIHQVEYQNFVPIKLHYTHTIAYPEDGLYGTGVRQGSIEILGLERNILEDAWLEDGKKPELLISRAKRSKTEIRRLNWF